jgi:hypothetical protein
MKSKEVALSALKKDLEKCVTMREFFDTIARHYDLDNARPGSISRITLISNVGSLIQLGGAKPKE